MNWYENPALYLVGGLILLLAVCLMLAFVGFPAKDVNKKVKKRDPHDFYRDDNYHDTIPHERD